MWTDQTLSWLALIRLLLCVGCHNQTRKLSVSGPAFAATVAGRVGPPEQHLYAGFKWDKTLAQRSDVNTAS